jgi:hypothetical protein
VRIGALYSHLNGHEWLLIHRKRQWKEVEEIIDRVDAKKCRSKESKERRKLRTMLYSPDALNKRFKEEFRATKWGESRTSYWVTDDYEIIRKTVAMAPDQQKAEIQAVGKQPIRSFNQTDFVKDRVAVEVQTGEIQLHRIPFRKTHGVFRWRPDQCGR